MAATASLIAALVLLSYPTKIKDQKNAMSLLSLMFFCLFFWISMDIIQSIDKLNINFSFIKPGFLSLLFMSFFVPIHYLHISSLIHRKLQRLNLLIHFILPGLILVFGILNYGNSLFNSAIKPLSILIHLQLVFYWLLEIQTALRILYLKKRKKFRVHKGWLKWVMFYLIILPTLFLPFFMFKISGNSTQDAIIIDIWEALGVLLISLSLFLKPDFLFGLMPIPLEEKKHSILRPKLDLKNHLNSGHHKLLKKQIKPYLDNHKPHLEKYFSIDQMANELGVSTNDLECFFWHQEGLSFEEYINQQRIIYSQTIIKKGAISQLTLDILAKKSGFKNRVSFINSFKEFTGYNAADYISHFLKIPSNK